MKKRRNPLDMNIVECCRCEFHKDANSNKGRFNDDKTKYLCESCLSYLGKNDIDAYLDIGVIEPTLKCSACDDVGKWTHKSIGKGIWLTCACGYEQELMK